MWIAGEQSRAVHLLSLLDQRTGFTFKLIVLRGRVITAVAVFCQRDLCDQIVGDGGHYFFEVKDNQPELKESIAAEFNSAFPPTLNIWAGRTWRRSAASPCETLPPRRRCYEKAKPISPSASRSACLLSITCHYTPKPMHFQSNQSATWTRTAYSPR